MNKVEGIKLSKVGPVGYSIGPERGISGGDFEKMLCTHAEILFV